jgi:opacity protein-like surface antigen
MKKIFLIVGGLFILLMLPGVSFCNGVPTASSDSGIAKQKPAQVMKASKAKKKVVSKAKSVQKVPYMSGNLGVSFFHNGDSNSEVTVKFHPGLALDGAAGYKYGKLRAEGEIGYQINDADKCIISGNGRSASGDVKAYSFLINGYYDFINKTAFTPYITAGIGVARLELNDLTVAGFKVGSFDDTVFAYQVGAGIGYAINNKFTADLKYRFFSTKDPELMGTKAEFASHNIYLGLRYNF